MRGGRRSSGQAGGAAAQDGDIPFVRRARDGDRAAFEELVRRHADRVYVVIRFGVPAGEAEEIVQETFMRAWRAIGAFKGRVAVLHLAVPDRDQRSQATHDPQRRPARACCLRRDVPGGDRRPGTDAATARRASGSARRLERAVRALPMAYRVPLVLRDIEGLSTAQAAAAMQLGEAAFKSRLHRARLAVREAMEDYLDAEGTT